MWKFVPSIGAVIVTFTSACGSASRPASAPKAYPSAPHILPPIRLDIPSPLDWLDATQAEIYSNIDAVNGSPEYVPDGDDLTQRGQFWLDALDSQLRGFYPDLFFDSQGYSIVPRPRIRIMAKAGANAFSTSASVCYRVPIRFAAPPFGATPSDDASVIQISPKGVVGQYAKSHVSCIDRTTTAADADLVVRHLQQTVHVQHCSLSTDQGAVVLGQDCHLGSTVQSAGASGIMLEPVSNWITLQTSLLGLMPNDDQLAYTILHEAAHYYRAHGSLDKQQYVYFYHIDAENLASTQPKSDADLNVLGQKLAALPKYRTQPLTGQTWHSEMFSYGRLTRESLVRPTCSTAASPCFEPCSAWTAIMDDPRSGAQFGKFPQQPLDDVARALYDKWEVSLSQCLAAIAIGDSALPATVLDAAARKVFWRTGPTQANQAPAATVLALASEMNAQFFARDAATDQLLQQALDQRLGYYTTEEEADNLAQAWLPLVGIAPKSSVDHWATFAAFKAGREQEGPYNLSAKDCLALYQSTPRWRESGRPVPVPVGAYTSLHHSSCFRMWNADQRLPFVPSPLAPSLLPSAERYGGPYADLRARAQAWPNP